MLGRLATCACYSSVGIRGISGVFTASWLAVGFGPQVVGNVRSGNRFCANDAVGTIRVEITVAVKAIFFMSIILKAGGGSCIGGSGLFPDNEYLDLIDCIDNIILSKLIPLKNRVMICCLI